MFTYTLNGTVLPERTYVSITSNTGEPLHIVHNDPTLGFNFDAYITIAVAQVMVVVKSASEIRDLEGLRNAIEFIVRGIVDAFGYIKARGYDVEMKSVVGDEGQPWQVFSIEIRELASSSPERPVTFPELFDLLHDPSQASDQQSLININQLRLALADMRESIRSPRDTALFCFRAIECIRQCFVTRQDGEDEQKLSWARMGKTLQIDTSWTESLRQASIRERHGAGKGMSKGDRGTSYVLCLESSGQIYFISQERFRGATPWRV